MILQLQIPSNFVGLLFSFLFVVSASFCLLVGQFVCVHMYAHADYILKIV